MSGNTVKYLGDLHQPHPNDIDRLHKWNINTRYHNFNLINLLFYNTCKTLEIRFVRPTFNFDKIMLWLAVFNAVLIYAEDMSNISKSISNIEDVYNVVNTLPCLETIIRGVYPSDFSDKIIDGLNLFELVIENQSCNGDYIGRDITIEEDILKDNLWK